MESYPRRYLKDKKYSQDDLIPIVVLFIGGNGGKATKKYVEEGYMNSFATNLARLFIKKK